MSLFFPPDATETATATTKPPRRRWLRRAGAVVVALVVLSLASSAIYLGSVQHSFTRHVVREDLLPAPKTGDAEGSTDGNPAEPAKPAGKSMNYVLMGSDARNTSDAGAGRSDTLMVLHLAADRKSAYLISFPRDMYVAIPDHGKNKINAAFAYGGTQLTVRTLEQLLGTPMDHVALVDFDGFINITDQLGGVKVVNKHKSSSRGHDFAAGEITLQGDRALAYVRERYGLPNGDLDRAERQRTVVKAILAKGFSAKTVANPAKFTGFIADLAKHLTLDKELTNAEIRTIGLSLRLTSKDVHSLQAPIAGFAKINGQSVDVVDPATIKELAVALQTDGMDDYAANQ